MIGHLQRNKVKAVLPLVKLVHSVDSLRLAEEVETAAVKLDHEAEVLLQVNISGEGTKFGLAAPAVPHLAEQMESMAHVRVRGLMTMAPQGSLALARSTFETLRDLRDRLGRRSPAPRSPSSRWG
jgi:uncharacterized pyridoxal phosphate-containing UPF0001 family protein